MNAPLVTGRLLNSKVAWRVFALFLISTVAPVGLLGLLTPRFRKQPALGAELS